MKRRTPIRMAVAGPIHDRFAGTKGCPGCERSINQLDPVCPVCERRLPRSLRIDLHRCRVQRIDWTNEPLWLTAYTALLRAISPAAAGKARAG